uniref:LOW QUALITY PROTEIN: protein SLX4IP n=1 Tax=Pristiophorus japonicus TaxID=55135 RepID=UPI00398E71F3
MPSNKFVLQCGNFAVLVDLHILPQGTSKDTSWFTEHHKEEISALVKEDVDLRIKQYLEARKQRGNMQPKPSKELTPSNPLCIKGQNFRLAAYFMKRHTNLRCVTKRQYCGLYIFPDRFVVCITPCETGPKKGMAAETITVAERGASEYFTGDSEMKELCNVSISIQKKKEALKHIVKKTTYTKMANFNKSETSNCLPKVLHAVTEDEQDVAQSAAGFSHEIQDINTGRTEDCMNSVQSKLLLPVIKLEKYINKRQPAQQNCQQQPQSIEQLKTGLKSTVGGNESALRDPKQNEVNTKIQTKRSRGSSQNGTDSAKKVISGETPTSLHDDTMGMNSLKSLSKTSEKKKLLKRNSHYKRSVKGKPDSLDLTNGDVGGYLFSVGNSPQDFCHMDKCKKRQLTTQRKLTKKLAMAPSGLSCSESVNSATSTTSVKVESEVENMQRKSRHRRPKRLEFSGMKKLSCDSR